MQCSLKNITPIILLIIVTGVITFGDQEFFQHVYYHRDALANGELWRLWTGHLTHTSYYHWLLNMAFVLVLYYFFSEYFDRQLWLMSCLVVMPFLSVLLYYFDTNLDIYIGFSGVIQGWISYLLIRSFHKTRLINAVLLCIQWGRILYEQLHSYDVNYMYDLIQSAVAINAHLFGASVGVLCGLLSVAIAACKNK